MGEAVAHADPLTATPLSLPPSCLVTHHTPGYHPHVPNRPFLRPSAWNLIYAHDPEPIHRPRPPPPRTPSAATPAIRTRRHHPLLARLRCTPPLLHLPLRLRFPHRRLARPVQRHRHRSGHRPRRRRLLPPHHQRPRLRRHPIYAPPLPPHRPLHPPRLRPRQYRLRHHAPHRHRPPRRHLSPHAPPRRPALPRSSRRRPRPCRRLRPGRRHNRPRRPPPRHTQRLGPGHDLLRIPNLPAPPPIPRRTFLHPRLHRQNHRPPRPRRRFARPAPLKTLENRPQTRRCHTPRHRPRPRCHPPRQPRPVPRKHARLRHRRHRLVLGPQKLA